MFTERYGMIPYITQICFVFKALIMNGCKVDCFLPHTLHHPKIYYLLLSSRCWIFGMRGTGNVELQHGLNNILRSDEVYCAWNVTALWAGKWNSNFEVLPYFINLCIYVFNIITVFHYLHVHINYNTLWTEC